ncbi:MULTISPECIES: aromatic amino acid transport family protein [unclassified Avibacterium]|uniref:aromatic amino acid transport family protein n=1 Tax=unclassified Avibacterium TaxID=2685287 RepID=UPI002026B828|nr:MULTISPECIES: aromatic amino acid transport family protein [unclassified Avibacterium]URL02788.1 aromatic amino acid transporter [Avibacterium sp. 20-126]MCW9718372.1 aromatic amino acid transporter [Avibacterium sp. 21-599]MCW9732092.1 aromatic amino acid transporter [Avibacterium sp. 20-15]URL04271.1 aromatic amino acid transporter [Avibacterium sp. 20-132]URL05794.1 aromatic amino acid transporter [Avibacterium sp. 21-595]
MKNKTFGSALLVAGTTIGAGMLAMPLTSAEMGFSYTLALLFALWILLSYSALLFVEVYQKAERKDAGIATLAEQYFGIAGRVLATLSLVIFMYAILSAYVTGGGSLLAGLMPFLGDNATSVSIVLFTLVLGVFIVISTGAVDALTRLLFLIKLAAFLLVLGMMLPLVTTDNLLAMPLKDFLIISASPVFFTSFGFHVIIPSINKYLDGDIRRLRIAIIGGTAIPLVAYILWQMATHGVFPQSEFVQIVNNDPTLNGLINATFQATGSSLISGAVRTFSTLALVTSFLGVALSLFDCLDDLLKRVNIKANRIQLGLLTFIPPLAFALFYPDGFIAALGYAGQMFTFYGLVLPVGMAWQARKRYPDMPYRVLGGNISLFIALLLGLLIMNVPFLIQAGYLPKVIG